MKGEGRGEEGREGQLIHVIGPKQHKLKIRQINCHLTFKTLIINENDDGGGDDNNDDNNDGDNSPLLEGSHVDSETQALRVE